ncbi:hypothetical protein ACEPVM_14780 [Pseudomonas aeruginosa]|uniref:hypothetical protein n=1 Tax=Pseudomonas aeruginosa TaxID=287 RepID=UPI00053E8FCE|nr:hypothetical protein [Pseudomonas aeruginosa]EKM6330998.1 hypothetical protein [Pseudomonas aeruginosa]EKX0311273.1 hypothetical protein [Pseudomonas aeruginosa]EKX7253782.1 hypothetical protein [Pseudomonas aeruginosa]ELF5756522.1 hypothetical protein [Pseudomonas aeruginosa]MBY9605064.1 hypothetical protein [Pseudomonas aeruginosa]
MANECDDVMGGCKLCGPDNGEIRYLCKSHLLPKAIYKYFNSSKLDGTKILVRPQQGESVFSMDRQIFKRLLCSSCEQLMSTKGEDYFISSALKIDKEKMLPSPVYNILYKSLIPSWNLFSSTSYGRGLIFSVGANFLPAIKSKELYHFAIGMFWKATFEGWTFCHAISLKPSLVDEMRKFLLGGSFLQGYIVRVVPSFWFEKYGVVFPTLIEGQPFFSICGFDFYLEESDKKFRAATSLSSVPLLFTVDSMRSELTFKYISKSYSEARQTNSSAETQLSWVKGNDVKTPRNRTND